MSDPALSVDHVTVAFDGLVAVSDVTLQIEKGERRALIGPNGAGKTTLFAAVGGQLRPAGGTVSLFGEDVTRLPSRLRARRGLGRTFQITNLLQDLTVRENILLASAAVTGGARYRPWRSLMRVEAVVTRADALLAQWELDRFRSSQVSELAYGQQRVLELAMAMAADPAVLLLDEPTAGVSQAEAQLFVEVIGSLPQDLTIMLIEHDMEVAFALADKVTVLANGEELVTGTPTEVQGNERVIEAYLGGHHAA